MKTRYRDVIPTEFCNCVTNTIRRLENAEPNRLFHAALLSDEALFWSRFDRSFSTSFGQRVIEEIWEIHKQFTALAKPKREYFIDEIIPAGI